MDEVNIVENRMKLHTLTFEQIEKLLEAAQVGRIASIDPEGYPYVVPVHFAYHKCTGKYYK